MILGFRIICLGILAHLLRMVSLEPKSPMRFHGDWASQSFSWDDWIPKDGDLLWLICGFPWLNGWLWQDSYKKWKTWIPGFPHLVWLNHCPACRCAPDRSEAATFGTLVSKLHRLTSWWALFPPNLRNMLIKLEIIPPGKVKTKKIFETTNLLKDSWTTFKLTHRKTSRLKKKNGKLKGLPKPPISFVPYGSKDPLLDVALSGYLGYHLGVG